MNITYFGQNCFLITINEIQILVDPYILKNPISSIQDISTIRCDYIFLTHGHADHCSDVLEILNNNSDAILISNYEVVTWFENKKEIKAIPMNIGGELKTKFGSIKVVNAVHSSSMPDGSYGGNPIGFIFYTEKNNFYVSGDTALTYDMKLIGDFFGPIDFAILPVGNHFTMGIKDANLAADFIKTKKVIGSHFNTFEWIKIEPNEAREYFEQNNKELILMDISESVSI